jgi:hypothetical protein
MRDPANPEPCLLPGGHSGVHSFELGAISNWPTPDDLRHEEVRAKIEAHRRGEPDW